MICQLLLFLENLPIASYPTTLLDAVTKGQASLAVRELEKIFRGKRVNCALRTDDGYLFFSRDGLLAPYELEEWNDYRRSKEGTASRIELG